MKRAVGRRTEGRVTVSPVPLRMFRSGSFVSAPGQRHCEPAEQSACREVQRVVALSEAVARQLRLDGGRVSDVLRNAAPDVDDPGTPWATGCPWS